MLLWIFLSGWVLSLSLVEAEVKNCQIIGNRNFMFAVSLKTCVVSRREKSEEEFTIGDVSDVVTALDFQRNRNIKVLPVDVIKSFPNLILFNAATCSVEAVAKKNFEGLVKLEEINLKENRIEKILGNTFEDQKALKRLILNGNILKQMNVDFIAEMPHIINLSLKKNVCVDQNLLSRSSIVNSVSSIKEKCGFDEETVA